MENEIKISELAKIWDVSVNTTWTRIKKEGLLTIKKIDNNREITFVSISDDILKKYEVNKVNNGYYEELLTDDNTSQPLNGVQNQDIIEKFIEFSNATQDRLITLNNNHNEEVNNLNEELMKFKSKIPLLEDKANREGLYLSEINGLKKGNKRLITWLITLIILFVISASVLTALLVIANNKPPKIVEVTKEIIKVVEKPVIKKK